MLPILTSLAILAAPQAVAPVGVLQQLEVPATPEGRVTLPIQLDGEITNLVLEPSSIRAVDFKLFATRPDGAVVEMPAPAPKTWRGHIEGLEDTMVTASITSEGLSAIVTDYASDREWQVQPAEGYPSDVYSVARVYELDVPEATCGVSSINQTPPPQTHGQTAALGTGLQLVEIAMDADFEFFQANGSSVSATVDDMERVMNRVDTIYTRDVDVQIQITALVIRSNSADPYSSTDAGTLLGQFDSEWSNNFVGVRRDVAHLFTGKNINGGTIGIAFLNAICSNGIGYGLSESRFTGNLAARTGLTAHELGHNFSANHCDGAGDCRIMCSGLGGCTGDVTQFGVAISNQIRNYAIGRPCLLDLAPAIAVPFTDDFEGGLDTDIWISNQFAFVNGNGVNEPSGTQSLEMNARNNGPERDDVVISNYLLLNGLMEAEVSLQVQHRGVPSGGFLKVDVYDVNRRWIEIARVVSDGVDETSYTNVSAAIPADGLHDRAQVRISAGVNGLTENWYVDDFMVNDSSCGGFTSYCVAGANSVTSNGSNLIPFGSTSITANDMQLLATGMPSNSFAIWLHAENQVQSPLGDGFLCVNGAQIFRYAVVQSTIFGENFLVFDHNDLAPGSVINVGDTQNFQAWYRDSIGAGFNLTNGMSVTFCP